MFGEEKLLGQIEATIDSKKRLILPMFTKREEGDNLVLIEDKDLNIFRLYPIEKVSGKFDKINDKLTNAKTEEEIKKYKKQIYDLSKTIIKTIIVDKTGRALLGESFAGITKINIIGANDHLILELKK